MKSPNTMDQSDMGSMPLSAGALQKYNGTLSVTGFVLDYISECSRRVKGKGIVLF
jgi:hypothetical protein